MLGHELRRVHIRARIDAQEHGRESVLRVRVVGRRCKRADVLLKAAPAAQNEGNIAPVDGHAVLLEEAFHLERARRLQTDDGVCREQDLGDH